MGISSIVYIDGFNFYYGFLKGTLYKWLDLQDYFVSLRQDDSIQKIKYFTALVSGDARVRQRQYLRALSTSSLVEVIYGVYKDKKVECKVKCQHLKKKKFFIKPEEKRTDVNIAITMLDDAYQSKCDRMILVSADSDLVPVVELIRKKFPSIEIIVYIPDRNNSGATAASELRNAATRNHTLKHGGLSKKSQFPNKVFTSLGIGYKKPSEWDN